jgi:hypothetical protein
VRNRDLFILPPWTRFHYFSFSTLPFIPFPIPFIHFRSFQIKSQDGTFSFAANSDEHRDEWVSALYPFTTESNTTKDDTSRQMSSFRIFIEEAQGLPVDKNYYCVVYFGNSTSGASVAKTEVQWKCKTGAPNWSERFFLDDLSPTLEEITIGVFSTVTHFSFHFFFEQSMTISFHFLSLPCLALPCLFDVLEICPEK